MQSLGAAASPTSPSHADAAGRIGKPKSFKSGVPGTMYRKDDAYMANGKSPEPGEGGGSPLRKCAFDIEV